MKAVSTARAEIERLLASDESARLEFKASLRTPVDPNPGNRPLGELRRDIEHGAIKTLAAFLNTDGGTLIIGVKNDHTIVGIDIDYDCVKPKDRDGWCLTFDDLVAYHLGTEVMKCLDLRLEPWDDHTIAVIRCSAREEPTWVGEELYVRRTASTEKLSTRHAMAWWRERWEANQNSPA